MRKLIALVVILAVLGFGASRANDWWNYQINAPASTTSQAVVFHVQPGELPDQVRDDLYTKGLIRDKTIFDLYVRLTGIGSKFQAGSFLMNKHMSLVQVTNALLRGKTDQITITIPEGFPLKFQANYVEKDWPAHGQAYLQAAADPS